LALCDMPATVYVGFDTIPSAGPWQYAAKAGTLLNVPIPGLSFTIPLVPVSAGGYALADLEGNVGAFKIQVGIDACATLPVVGQKCGSDLTSSLPYFFLGPWSYNFSSICAERPPAGAVFKISDCGVSDFNGFYRQSGEHNGSPTYEHIDNGRGLIQRSKTGHWKLKASASGDTAYTSKGGSTEMPPLDSWIVKAPTGIPPAPQLTVTPPPPPPPPGGTGCNSKPDCGHGVCVPDGDKYSCACHDRWSGTHCQIKPLVCCTACPKGPGVAPGPGCFGVCPCCTPITCQTCGGLYCREAGYICDQSC
jgi:hypothetical protein